MHLQQVTQGFRTCCLEVPTWPVLQIHSSTGKCELYHKARSRNFQEQLNIQQQGKEIRGANSSPTHV